MKPARILLVEDEAGLVLTLRDRLQAEGHTVVVAESAEQGLQRVEEVDLILLDVRLPGMDGFELCRSLRADGCSKPILMLTARATVGDRVEGLRLGADDYLVKPFAPEELSARIEALLRRARGSAGAGRTRFGDFELDHAGRALRRGGVELELTAMEFELLAYLVRHAGEVVTREAILREVWGFHRAPRTRTVDVHVTWLRRKLEADRSRPRYIQTVRGIGYKFVGTPGPEAGARGA